MDVPIYNFVTHRREEKTVSMYGANVLIFEGILSFHNKEVRIWDMIWVILENMGKKLGLNFLI